MTDRLDFETRLEERLRARAALASRPFDAAAVAREAIAVNGRRWRLGWPSLRPALRLLVVAALLALAVVGAVAGVGALLRERPTVPPSVQSNGHIAVSAAGDIYLVESGALPRRIVGLDGDGLAQACPTFSPEGGRLAYGEGRPDPQPADNALRGRTSVADRAVTVVGLNDRGDATSALVRVSPQSGPGPVACPEWSPTGTHLAFRAGQALFIADAASGITHSVPIDPQDGWAQNELEWSRDGSLIAVAEPGEIRVVGVDGLTSVTIPVEGGTPASLGWTARDERIVYVVTDEPGDGRAIHAVTRDGQSDTQLTPDSRDPAEPDVQLAFADAAVSPDGRRVAFVQWTWRCLNDGCTLGSPRLLTMELDGSSTVTVPIPEDIGVSGVQWSPDGHRLLFGSIDGVFSVGVAPGTPAVKHSSGNLDLEWSGSEVSWQPTFR